MAEIWDIYTKNREKTGRTIPRTEWLKDGEFHLVIHLWIQNSKNEFLIQKRSENLSWMPGLWAATGGSAISGEDSLKAIIRETQEELGINLKSEELQLRFTQIGPNDIADIWLVHRDFPISAFKFSKEDVSEIKWETKEKIQRMIEFKSFIDYGQDYFKQLFF